jgi:hypothetical protein
VPATPIKMINMALSIPQAPIRTRGNQLYPSDCGYNLTA